MRKPLILLMLFVYSVILSSQNTHKTVLFERDSLLELYFRHRDTMTIRTWTNLVKINKYLEEIRKYDSILLIENSKSLEKPLLMLNDLQNEIDSLKKHNEAFQRNNAAENKQSHPDNTTFIFIFVVFSVLLVFSLILFIGYYRARKNAVVRENESRNYLTKLNEANEEIEAMLKSENDLTHKLNILQSNQEINFAKIIKEKSDIEGEKILMENQIVEIRKAYDFEVGKRMEKESELELCKHQYRVLANSQGAKQEIIDMEKKVKLIDFEKEEMEKELLKMQAALDTEVKSHKKVNAELEGLMLQLKNGGFLQEGSHELIHLSTEIATQKQLIDENEALTEELKNLRLKYEQELKMKMQMKDDLDQIISKIKRSTFG